VKHLIIFSHPNPESFNNAIKETYDQALTGAGHEVRVRDLYAEQFDPVLKASDLELIQKGLVAQDVQTEQGHVEWADVITFIFPMWWQGPPAITRGYIDRVFCNGFAYLEGEKGVEGLLSDKKVFIFCTMAAPVDIYEKTGMLKSIKQTLDEGICQFCGIKKVEQKYFGLVTSASEAERKKMLEEVKQIAAKEEVK
jgi:NAD(P)H dehydrogenase (quinone)